MNSLSPQPNPRGKDIAPAAAPKGTAEDAPSAPSAVSRAPGRAPAGPAADATLARSDRVGNELLTGRTSREMASASGNTSRGAGDGVGGLLDEAPRDARGAGTGARALPRFP